MSKKFLVASLVAACTAPTQPSGAAKPTPSVAAKPAPSVAAKPEPVAGWWHRAPIETAVADRDGCQADASAATIALSVDGKPSGVFLRGVSGAHGELTIAPGRVSSARITLGVVELATAVALEQTSFYVKHQMPLVGGILALDQFAKFHVVGGDRDSLSLQLVANEMLEWVTPPTLRASCSELGREGWELKDVGGKLEKSIAKTARIAVRATLDGPVVAHITNIERITVLETKGAAVKIVAYVGTGNVTGWTEAAALVPAPAPEPPGLAGGAGFLSKPHVTCDPGTALYVLKDAKLYTVGALTTRPPAPSSPDWRYVGGKIVLDGSRHNEVPSDVPWIALGDDLRMTNYFWTDETLGTLVVPAATCSVSKR